MRDYTLIIYRNRSRAISLNDILLLLYNNNYYDLYLECDI